MKNKMHGEKKHTENNMCTKKNASDNQPINFTMKARKTVAASKHVEKHEE